MKKILFVIDEIIVGGAQKSLLSLLSVIDPKEYEVDLLIFNEEGGFRNLIPGNVRIIKTKSFYGEFFSPIMKSIKRLLRARQLYLAFVRGALLLITKLTKDESYYFRCDFLVNPLDLRKKYDIAIACHYRLSNYFLIKRVCADSKYAWYHHGEYKVPSKIHEFDKWCYNKLDKIITVSESSCRVLKRSFPQYSDKIVVLKNIISTQLIRHMAEEQCNLQADSDCFRIVTVGRLSPEKGTDLVVNSCKELIRKGYSKIKWYIIGEGAERRKLEELIKFHGLEKVIILLGERLNPYKYIKSADIYVQPSLVESFGLAIAEAKILLKPIVSTDTDGALEQIQNNKNGLVTNKTGKDISEAIITLIENTTVRERLIKNLKYENLDSCDEVKRFYNLVNGLEEGICLKSV